MFMLPCLCSPKIADVGKNLAKIHRIQRHCTPKSQAGADAIANSHVFEVTVLLCLLGVVIGAFQEGETGMRCGPIRPIPQLPPQL
jgi:hypothetical protein